MHEGVGNIKSFQSKSTLGSKSENEMQALNAWCWARNSQLSCTNSFIQVLCNYSDSDWEAITGVSFLIRVFL